MQGAGCRVQGEELRAQSAERRVKSNGTSLRQGFGWQGLEIGILNIESEIFRNLKLKSFSHVSAIVNHLFSIVSKMF